MDVLERIRMIMKMNQLNASAFADKIGVQRSNVSHVLTGRNKPSLDFIEKVLQHFPKVNASWLITGQIQQPEPLRLKQEAEKPSYESVKKSPDIDVQAVDTSNTEVPAKKIVKVITFYDDFTFDEYKMNS